MGRRRDGRPALLPRAGSPLPIEDDNTQKDNNHIDAAWRDYNATSAATSWVRTQQADHVLCGSVECHRTGARGLSGSLRPWLERARCCPPRPPRPGGATRRQRRLRPRHPGRRTTKPITAPRPRVAPSAMLARGPLRPARRPPFERAAAVSPRWARGGAARGRQRRLRPRHPGRPLQSRSRLRGPGSPLARCWRRGPLRPARRPPFERAAAVSPRWARGGAARGRQRRLRPRHPGRPLQSRSRLLGARTSVG